MDAFELGKTRSVLVYDESELRAFKAELETKTYKPAVDPTPTNTDLDGTELSRFVEVTQLLPLLDGLNHLTDVVKLLREEQEVDRLSVPIHHKLTLSLAYAVRPCGNFAPTTPPGYQGWHTSGTDHSQNSVPVAIYLLGWKYQASMALVVLLTFSLGVFMGFLLSLPRMIYRMTKIASLKRTVAEQDRRIADLDQKLLEAGKTGNSIPSQLRHGGAQSYSPENVQDSL